MAGFFFFFLLHTCIVRSLTLSFLLLSMVTAAPGCDSVWRREKAVDISLRRASLLSFSQAGMSQKQTGMYWARSRDDLQKMCKRLAFRLNSENLLLVAKMKRTSLRVGGEDSGEEENQELEYLDEAVLHISLATVKEIPEENKYSYLPFNVFICCAMFIPLFTSVCICSVSYQSNT